MSLTLCYSNVIDHLITVKKINSNNGSKYIHPDSYNPFNKKKKILILIKNKLKFLFIFNKTNNNIKIISDNIQDESESKI